MKRPSFSLAPVKVSVKSWWSTPQARRYRAVLVVFVIIATAVLLGYIILSDAITGMRSELDANQKADELIGLEHEMNNLIKNYMITHSENEDMVTDTEVRDYRHLVRWYPLLEEESVTIGNLKSTLNSLDRATSGFAGPIVYLSGEKKTKALALLSSARNYQNSARMMTDYLSDANNGYLSGVEIYMKIGNGNSMISFGDSRTRSAQYLAQSYNYYLEQCNEANRQWNT